MGDDCGCTADGTVTSDAVGEKTGDLMGRESKNNI